MVFHSQNVLEQEVVCRRSRAS